MYKEHKDLIFENYIKSKEYFVNNPQRLIELEKMLTDYTVRSIQDNIPKLQKDYNEASILYPFWANYPPEDRGRAPKGDQIPWIEVGEHAIGENLSRMMFKSAVVREVGLPSGPDNRYVVQCKQIQNVTKITDSAMMFMDIKSVGPRDDAEHIVLSHYQASGDGIWNDKKEMLTNTPVLAKGARKQHQFYPSMSPIYCLSDGTIAPTVHIFVKPIYDMIKEEADIGQPLKRIKVICMPNGLLLTVNPNYLKQHPNLLFPGKDDSKVRKEKKRCRLSFDELKSIDPWRVQVIEIY